MASEDVTPIPVAGPQVVFGESQASKFIDHEHLGELTQSLASLQKRGAFTDIVLKTKHKAVPCHKVIIAAACPFFRLLLQEIDSKDEVDMTDINSDIMEMVIDFIYTGEINVTTENVQALSQVCSKLELKKLKSACDEFMSGLFGPCNSFSLYMFAKSISLKLTMGSTKKYMMNQLKTILQDAPNNEYRALDENDLVELIASDDLAVDDEALVFELVVKWVDAYPAKRLAMADRVLQYVRFPLCSTNFLCDVVEKSSLMKTNAGQQLLNEAKNYHMLPERRASLQSPRTGFRLGQKEDGCFVLIGGIGQGKAKSATCWVFDEESNMWKTLTEIPSTNLWYFKVCNVGRDIIVTGGRPSRPRLLGNEVSDAWVFHTVDNKWERLPSMLTPRATHTMACIGEDVYVVGGFHHGPLKSVEKLDKERESWTKITQMTKSLYHMLAAGMDGKLYVVAGVTNSGASKMTQMYDPQEDKWHRKADMPKAFDRGSSAVLQKTIYLVGGVAHKFLAYDTTLDNWVCLTEPKMANVHPAATVWKGKVILGGGRSARESDDPVENVEAYDIKDNQWVKWEIPLPCGLSGHCMLNVRS